jgi:mRNA interferase RelE/StbE
MNHLYEVIYEPAASRQIKKLGANRDRVQRAIDALAYNPRPSGCKKLKPHAYRIRVGDWRVIYVVLDSPDFVVIISKVALRNEQTYRGF